MAPARKLRGVSWAPGELGPRWGKGLGIFGGKLSTEDGESDPDFLAEWKQNLRVPGGDFKLLEGNKRYLAGHCRWAVGWICQLNQFGTALQVALAPFSLMIVVSDMSDRRLQSQLN